MNKTKDRFRAIERRMEGALQLDLPGEAFGIWEQSLALFVDDQRFYGLLVRPMLAMQSQEGASLALEVVENFRSPLAFQKLASYFSRQGLFHLTIPLLRRAYSLDPQWEPVVYELAVALSFEGFHREALRILQGYDRGKENFWFRYELGWNRVFLGALGQAREDLFWMEARLQEAGEGEEKAEYAYHRLKDTILRYQQAKRPGRDLVKWHFILYGSAMLERPHLEESIFFREEGVAAVFSLEPLIARAARWVEIYQPPRSIQWVGDENSQILAQLFSLLLHLPVRPLQSSEGSRNSLVVASKAEYFPDFLLSIEAGQTLFCPYLLLQHPQKVCPDLVGTVVAAPFIYPWIQEEIRKDRLLGLWEKEQQALLEKKKKAQFPRFFQRAQALWMAGGVEKYPLGRYSYSGEKPFPLMKIL